jgi:di/tricarboxylate transporter
MTLQIGIVLILVASSVALFAIEKIPADVTALSLVLALIFAGILTPEVAFAGFGSDTVIMILGLLLLTAGLMRTGVMDIAGGAIIRLTGRSPLRLLIVVMIASAVLGAFMSNTASTAFFVPIVIGLAERARISPSQLLLPLAFSSILTSSVTLISTSTNIVVSGLMKRYQLEPMGMFELAPVGVPIAVAGLIYMGFVGRKWLPKRLRESETTLYGLRPYMTEVLILPDSSLIGKTLAESKLGKELDLTVVRIVRGKSLYLAPRGDMELHAGDVVLVEGPTAEILKIKDTAGIEIKPDVTLAHPDVPAEELGLVEAILLPRSPLIGRTLRGVEFRQRYGLQVLGLNRHGEILREKMSEVTLHLGDILLVQGPREKIAALAEGNAFRIIGTPDEKRPNRKRAPYAIAIFAIALGLGTFKVMALPVAVILGAVAAFLTRCITPDEAYREIEWKAVILIACMLAMGAAMEQTGTAKYLAGLIINGVGQFGPNWLLAGFFVLTVVLTQPMSNQAAAVVVLPVAIQTAAQLDLNPRSFAMMIAVAASCSYLTPLEPSCLMVYGPGRYRFADFLKIGSLLTVIIFAIAMLLVPKVWPVNAKSPQPAKSHQIETNESRKANGLTSRQ